jgi:hypothetical protein
MSAVSAESPNTTNTFLDRDDVLKRIRAAFVERDPQYPARKEEMRQKLAPLAARLDNLQKVGHPMTCSEQVQLEIKWLTNYQDDWVRVAHRIEDLQKSLNDLDQSHPIQDEDGSFGGCCTEWYRKLEPTVDALQGELGVTSLKPLQFLNRLADPDRLRDYLFRLQITDINSTGKNNRDELGAAHSALSQLIFKDQLRDLLETKKDLGFSITPELEVCYSDYLEQTQHPRTGYWGPWYRFGDQLLPVQDLSMTFHIISYRSGVVSNWSQVIESTFEIKDLVYPAGWKPDAQTQYSNHNNFDVLTIFFFGWPHMNAQQKQRARREITLMLHWCLTASLRDDGFDLAGESPVDAYYFGVRFLDRVGFWDRAKRFWLQRDPGLPNGLTTPFQICQKLRSGFGRLQDRSEEGATVSNLLRTAACASSPAYLSETTT